MNPSTFCPLLREDVLVEPSDQVGGLERFIVAIDWHHFLVDRSTAYLINALRNPTSYEALTERLRRDLGQALEVEEVRHVVETRLPPALFSPSEGRPKSPLSWQRRIIPGPVVNPLALIASKLVNKPAAIVFLSLLLLVDIAVFVRWHQQPLMQWDYTPWRWLVVTGFVVLGVLIHELGHISALRHYGKQSGGIGFGIYWFFPTFYSDVSETWRLPGRQRAVVDVGGLYFQSIYMVAIGIWALSTTHMAIPILVMWTTHFMMLYTLNPTLKFDGYWLLSDLTGCTNLHARIRSSARHVVARLCGQKPAASLSLSRKWTLAGFVGASLLYFTYVFASLISGLINTLSSLMESAGDGWGSLLGMGFVAILLSVILLMLLRRCLRVLSALFIDDPLDSTTEKATES